MRFDSFFSFPSLFASPALRFFVCHVVIKKARRAVSTHSLLKVTNLQNLMLHDCRMSTAAAAAEVGFKSPWLPRSANHAAIMQKKISPSRSHATVNKITY